MAVATPPWVTPYLEDPWVKVLSQLAPQFPPAGTDSNEDWQHFAIMCLTASAIIVLVGAVVGLAVLMRSCCCFGRRPTIQPSSKPVMCTSTLTLVLIAAGVFAYLAVGRKGMTDAVTQVDGLLGDVSTALQQGTALSQTGGNISAVFNATIPKCSTPEAKTQLESVAAQIETYRAAIEVYSTDVQALPKEVEDAKSGVNVLSLVVLYGFLGPLALVTVCCLAIFVVVCTTRGAGGRGRCSSCCIRSLGAALFAPAVIAVAVLTGSELGVGVAMSSFCRDVDTNALTVMHQLGNEVAYNITCSYITGGCVNPLTREMQQANNSITLLGQQLQTAEVKHLLSKDCNAPTAPTELANLVASTSAPLSTLRSLLDPTHVYPYYNTIVRENACTTMVSGLGWLVLSQIVVGLVFLPTLTCMADTFFGRWVAWHSQPLARPMRHPYATGQHLP
uniref:Protein tweety homolog n=1 Tax=Zooxanthella nutricula TaxID=1333877 RepID=A0A7S2KZF4_9DINO